MGLKQAKVWASAGVQNVGDFDGDGADDIMVTSVGEAGQSGYAYILSGLVLTGFLLMKPRYSNQGMGTKTLFCRCRRY